MSDPEFWEYVSRNPWYLIIPILLPWLFVEAVIFALPFERTVKLTNSEITLERGIPIKTKKFIYSDISAIKKAWIFRNTHDLILKDETIRLTLAYFTKSDRKKIIETLMNNWSST